MIFKKGQGTVPKVTFIDAGGIRHEVIATSGDSVMHVAVSNMIPGILAECGGNCACATCHVFVENEWCDRVPAKAASEDAMLYGAAVERQPNSRLSCQLTMNDQLDGLVVRLPERQI